MSKQAAVRRTRKGLMPVIIAAAVLIGGAAIATQQHGGGSHASAADDLRYVWSLADTIPIPASASSERHWLLRYDVTGMRSGQALRAAGLLGLHKSEVSTEHAADKEDTGDTYIGTIETVPTIGETADTSARSDANADSVASDTNTAEDTANTSGEGTAVEVSMLIHTDRSSNDSIIVVKPPPGVDMESLTSVAHKIEQAVHEAGGQYAYSFRVSGTAAPDTTAQGLQALKQLFTDVVAKSDAELVENYEDKEGMTISESRYSPHIEQVMKTNGKKSNLQLTVHQDSESTALDWVIGVPVITGDYAEAD
ncbi:YwmB family TATA-box binding protein [Paenibacillus sp. PR3]|uniref:YwmB family TATA-box binding protein n=1 Tax=Paenibacillus terricola TaxID=2763503 RepID=A0ABR8MMG1_9BACL|nr:YwmB family TATA-box binding protein [Paenibacillus terricola]MBD3917148.1 YwmB family TATA-box binding protein [Paenibacillus terricola]